jgi:hypothetical protein
MERGWRSEHDYFKQVCNEFHTRVDWQLQDHEEPALPLPEFDPKKRLPDLEKLPAPEKECAARMGVLNAVSTTMDVTYITLQCIRRWLKYHVKRLCQHVCTKISSEKDPWAIILLAKLSGVTSPPKAQQGYQQYMCEQYTNPSSNLEKEVKARWAATPAAGSSIATAKEPNAPFQTEVAHDLFVQLPNSDCNQYRVQAKVEVVTAQAAYNKALTALFIILRKT